MLTCCLSLKVCKLQVFCECCRMVVILILNVYVEVTSDVTWEGVTEECKLIKKLHLAALTLVCR